MKPIIHAISSEKKHGGISTDYFQLHQLMDSAKISIPDVRHRMMFHHEEGIGFIKSILGDKLKITGTKKRVPTATICREHIDEDLSFIPTLQQYLNLIKQEEWMNKAMNSVPKPSKRQTELEQFILSFLTDDVRSIILVGNTHMPYIAETKFGPLFNGKPTRDLAENFINTFVKIEGLEFLLDDMQVEEWMIRPAIRTGKIEQPAGKKKTIIHQTVRDTSRMRLD